MTAEQLAFDLGHRPAMGHEDFLVAASNADAVAWLDRWPEWPSHALALYGPDGCGKSHLAHVWRATTQAALVAARDLGVAEVAALAPARGAVIVEDAGEGIDEEALLHLYNLLAERRGYLLLVGREAPARWRVALPDLRSRLKAMAAVVIHPPDDALLSAVLIKMFADRQLRVEPEVVRYLVARVERSFGAAREAAEALDKAALARRSGVTVPLARQVLGHAAEERAGR